MMDFTLDTYRRSRSGCGQLNDLYVEESREGSR